MKPFKPAALTAALLISALVCADAWAQGRGGHGGGGGHAGHGGNGGHGAYAVHPGGHFHGGPVGGGYRRHRGYVGGAIIVGAAPLYWSNRWYGDPYYDYYAPGAYIAAPVYLPPSDAGQTLYYCDSPHGYYPNVSGCRLPWRGVIVTEAPPR